MVQLKKPFEDVRFTRCSRCRALVARRRKRQERSRNYFVHSDGVLHWHHIWGIVHKPSPNGRTRHKLVAISLAHLRRYNDVIVTKCI
jgi:hypothetical protein